MKNTKYIALAAVLVLVIAGAAIGYRVLTAEYEAPDIAVTQATEEVTSAAAQTTADASAQPAQTSLSEQGVNTATAPDFTVVDVDGNVVNLSDCFGKPVVINFWATWCSPCRSELPAFDKLYDAYGSEVTFLMVNLTDGSRDTIDSVKQFVSSSGYGFPVYFDTDENAAYEYSVYSIPLTVFIDRDGNVTGSHTGMMSEEKLTEYINKLMEE